METKIARKYICFLNDVDPQNCEGTLAFSPDGDLICEGHAKSLFRIGMR
jgi:hypothetical protein